jgi:hypothetical protein
MVGIDCQKTQHMHDLFCFCRLKIVGEKLGLSQFSSAEECFVAMDKDHGGTLSRKEIAVGLLKVQDEAPFKYFFVCLLAFSKSD